MPQDFKEVEDYFSQRVGGSVFADIQPRNLFAGPESTLLDEVVITGRDLVGKISTDPIVPKGLSPTALEGIFGIASRFLNPLLMLATPGNMGPRGTGELQPDMIIDNTRDALPELDEVVINPPRPPSTPPGYAEPDLPPNWNDMLDWSGPVHWFNIPIILTPWPFGTSAPDVRDSPADRPRAVPGSPTGSPEYSPLPTGPTLRPQPGPSTGTTPSVPAPDLFPDPYTLPFPDPFGTPGDEPSPYGRPFPTPGGDPFPSPDPFADPLENPTPRPDPTRDPFGSPVDPDGFFDPHEPTFTPGPGADPDLNPFPDPFTPTPPKDADTCNCEKEPKKKKKKKSEPRTVCYRGTYRQLRKGIMYNKLEEVPCDASAPKSKTAKARKPKAPRTIGDLRDIIFGTP